MAEPFSVAAGALQVAGAGLKFASSLYTFIEAVRGAKSDLESVAAGVKATTSVLQQLSETLSDVDTGKLCKPSILETANDALRSCEKSFETIAGFIDDYQSLAAGDWSLRRALQKLQWHRMRRRIVLAQVNVERHKTTLMLAVAALSLAKLYLRRLVACVPKRQSCIQLANMTVIPRRLMQVTQAAKQKNCSKGDQRLQT